MLRYRDFPFPLNVLLNVLTREEGRAENMHYGLFEAAGDSIGAAQERSTALLLSRQDVQEHVQGKGEVAVPQHRRRILSEGAHGGDRGPGRG